MNLKGTSLFEGALLANEARFKAILDAIPDLIFIVDVNGRFVDYSPSTLFPSVNPPESFLGKTILEVLPADIAQTAMEALQKSFQTREPQSYEYALMVGGAERLYESRMTAINDEQAAVIVRDITESKRRERLIQAELDLYSNLDQKYSLNEMLHECLQSAMVVSAMDCGGIYLVNSDGSLDLVVHCELSEAFVEASSHYDSATENARLVQAGQPIYVEYEKLGIDLDELREKQRLLSIGIVPILHSGKVIACLNTASHSRNEISREARRALESIAGHVGMVVIRAQVEESLKKSEQNLNRAQGLADIGHWNLDSATLQVTGSDEFYNIFGMARDEVTLDALAAVVHPDDRDFCLSRIRRGIEHGENWNIEHRLVSGDGTEKVVHALGEAITDEAGETVQLICTIQDITKRKQAEEWATRFNHVLESSHNEIYIFDADTLQFVDVNRGARENLGYSIEELRAITPLDLKPEFTPESFAELVEPLRTGIEERIQFTTVHRRKDRTQYPVEVHLQLMTNGAPLFVAFIFDITERNRLERQLRQSEKMQAVGQLAGGIAHDFNNQLTGIMGYADMLVGVLEDEKLRSYAEAIVKAAKRSEDLTQQLLAFARKGKNQSISVNLHKVISEVAALLERSIDKRITIRQVLSANPCIAIGDPAQLQNALLNLAINARDAMPEGGEISFETTIVTLDEEYCTHQPYDINPGRYVQVTVTDSGVGMDEETQKRMFEPFFTTKEQGQGTGMGLAAVYGTIKNHRGSIKVNSELGNGTAIKVYLPLAESTADLTEIAGQATPVKGIGRILLVDDEAIVRDVTAIMLRKLGYEVTVCEDGAEAVEYYRTAWNQVDLVILDMVMPKLGGRDAFIAMRQINPEIKALLSSGYAINGEAQSILDAGVFGFLQKPFQLATLAEKIAEIKDGPP